MSQSVDKKSISDKQKNWDTHCAIPTEVLENREISLEALGVFMYMLSFQNHTPSLSEVKKHFKNQMGKVKFKRIFNELKSTGYLYEDGSVNPRLIIKGDSNE